MAKAVISGRKAKREISPSTSDDPDDKKAQATPLRLRARKVRLVCQSFQSIWSPLAVGTVLLFSYQLLVIVNLLQRLKTEPLETEPLKPEPLETSDFYQRPAMLQTLNAHSVKKMSLRDKPPSWVKNHSQHYSTSDDSSSSSSSSSSLSLPDSLDQDCVPLGDWQDQHKIITCNTFHEIDMTDVSKVEFVGKGGQNTVWAVQEYEGTRRALKTPGWLLHRYVNDTEFGPSPFYYEDHRIQAVIYDELSSSPYIPNMYGFCSYSNLMDYSSETLEDLFDNEKELPTKNELFRIAYDLAKAMADAHHFDSQGHATIVHRDMHLDQFILIDGLYKLNDFNLAHLLRWNPEDDEYCGFKGRGYTTTYKAPEEYLDAFGDYTFTSEKADVYSLGYVLRFLLTGEEPFEVDEDDKRYVQVFMKGIRLNVNQTIRESTHPFDIAVRTMMNKCLAEEPSDRPTSQEVAEYLHTALLKAGLAPTPTN